MKHSSAITGTALHLFTGTKENYSKPRNRVSEKV
jgi:hypothetical protein